MHNKEWETLLPDQTLDMKSTNFCETLVDPFRNNFAELFPSSLEPLPLPKGKLLTEQISETSNRFTHPAVAQLLLWEIISRNTRQHNLVAMRSLSKMF